MTEQLRHAPLPPLPAGESASPEPLGFTFSLPTEYQDLAALAQAATTAIIVELPQPLLTAPGETVGDATHVDPDQVTSGQLTGDHLNATPAVESQSQLDPVAALANQVIQAAEQQASHFTANYQRVATAVETGAKLLGALTQVFKFAAAACPHCAVVAVQGTAQAGRMFGLGGVNLGHWHADGSYHEEDHEGENNPFAWLRVEQSAPVKRKAA